MAELADELTQERERADTLDNGQQVLRQEVMGLEAELAKASEQLRQLAQQMRREKNQFMQSAETAQQQLNQERARCEELDSAPPPALAHLAVAARNTVRRAQSGYSSSYATGARSSARCARLTSSRTLCLSRRWSE